MFVCLAINKNMVLIEQRWKQDFEGWIIVGSSIIWSTSFELLKGIVIQAIKEVFILDKNHLIYFMLYSGNARFSFFFNFYSTPCNLWSWKVHFFQGIIIKVGYLGWEANLGCWDRNLARNLFDHPDSFNVVFSDLTVKVYFWPQAGDDKVLIWSAIIQTLTRVFSSPYASH